MSSKERIFEFRKHSTMCYIGGGSVGLVVYDGLENERYVEYGDRIRTENKIRIGGEEIRRIREVLDDHLLFETEHLEGPYQMMVLDGVTYEFHVAVNGLENDMTGSNIDDISHLHHFLESIVSVAVTVDL